MGASEYEWGALPESLGNIRNELNDYTYLDVPLSGKVITVFCKDSQKADIKQYLTELGEGKIRLKCYSDFDNYIKDGKMFKCKSDFWWDIENHLMFWKKDVGFESKFKVIISTKPE